MVTSAEKSGAAAEKSQFAFHEGEALLRIAGYYPTLIEVIFECVQNALDKNAKHIWIVLNQKSKHLTIRDDGDGVTRAEFEKALTSVCTSIKKEDRLGRFGIGLISPLGKCEVFTFTSTPKSDPRGYLAWTFKTADLRSQNKIEGIPMQINRGLRFVQGGMRVGHNEIAAEWRTQVRMENITTDRILGRVTTDSLAGGVLDRFARVMKRNGTVISARIYNADGTDEHRAFEAEEWRGEKLEELTITNEDAGNILFRLYIAPKTEKGRKGKVVLGEKSSDFRVSFENFARFAENLLVEEVAHTLLSGIFEGEIVCEKVKLHAGRKSFEKSEAFVGLCLAIEEWHRRVGRGYLKEIQKARQEQRYQELTIRSLKVLEGLIKSSQGSWLKHVIETFKKGTVGTGHADVSHKATGEQEEKSKATSGKPDEPRPPREKKDSGEGKKRPESKEPKEGHHPFTVLGPEGQQRTVVRSDSLGLQISHGAMEGSDKLWVLETETGTLHFNTRHPLWLLCDDNDRALMRLQEYVVVQALTLEEMPEEWREVQRTALDEVLKPYAFTLRFGDDLAGRKPGRKKTE